MKINSQTKLFIYALSFIEGASVMSAELLGAKMLAPFYGSSLYVWATVMAVTLGGLALGYFAGGHLAIKNKNSNMLFYIVILAAICTAIMPISLKFVNLICASFSLVFAIIFSTIIFLMPPVLLMGMVSPLIIEKLNQSEQHAGKTAGSVYAISTLGGILATFLMGFYIIPNFGLSKPALFTGIILSILPLYAILFDRTKLFLSVTSFILIGTIIFKQSHFNSDIKILYQQEGLLGQVMVVDYPVYQKNNTPEYCIRMMLFNRVIQTFYNKNDSAHRYFPYVSILVDESSKQIQKGNALLLGLGGGCVANELQKKNFNVDAVELDERVGKAATKYFNLNKKTKVFIDDARRHIKHSNKKYDLIVFDVFKGEENPAHILTTESLEEVKKLLNPLGMIAINTYGFRNGIKSRGNSAIIKTLQSSGFYTNIIPSSIKEEEGNLLIFAKQEEFKPFNQTIQFKLTEIASSPILTDDKPILEMLNKEAVMAWRIAYVETAIKDFNQRNVPLFN